MRSGIDEKLGQNWLLLRGLARESAHWGDFIGQMQTAFPSAAIHTLDIPGTGNFYRHNSPDSIAGMVQFLREQALDQGMLEQKLSLMALSMGGMIACEWMRSYPQDIAGAALVNTSFAGISPFHKRMRWQSYGRFSQILLKNNVYQRELAILKLVSNRPERYLKLAGEWGDIQLQRPVSLSNSLRQILAAARYRTPSEKPCQPILLLNSRGDRLVAPACSIAISNNWRIDLRSHPWAGHDLALDDGEWLADQLKRWVLNR